MGTSRRTRAVAIVQRRVLALLPRATAEGTTVTVARHYTQLGKPASVSWTGDVAGFAQRIATALYGHGDPDETDDLNTSLRDRLGDALIAAGTVPATMPVEILAQAGVLADAVLPVATRHAQSAAHDAIQQAAALFESRHRALLDGDIMTSAEAAQLLREHAEELTEEKDTPPGGAEFTPGVDRDQVLRGMARQVRAIGKVKGWSVWAADYMDPDVEFIDTSMPSTSDIVTELRRLDRSDVRAAAFREAAALVGNDDDCGCDGCDSCVPNKLAAELRRMADEAELPVRTNGASS